MFKTCDGEVSDIIATIEYQIEKKAFCNNKVEIYDIYFPNLRNREQTK